VASRRGRIRELRSPAAIPIHGNLTSIALEEHRVGTK